MTTYNPTDPKRKSAWPIWILLLIAAGAAIAGLVALADDDYQEPGVEAAVEQLQRERAGEVPPMAPDRAVQAEIALDEAEPGETPPVVVDLEPAVIVGGEWADDETAVTSLDALVEATDEMDGQLADLDELRVVEVVGDRAFYVASAADAAPDKRVLVVLDEMVAPTATAGDAREVERGQLLHIRGLIIAASDVQLTDRGISPAERRRMEASPLFLRASSVQILQGSDERQRR